MKKLTKIALADFPLMESSKSIEEYGASVWNSLFTLSGDHKSPPIDYWVAGYIVGEIKCGEPLQMMRTIRNGVETPGLFRTTPITNIGRLGDNIRFIETANSLYKVEDYE